MIRAARIITGRPMWTWHLPWTYPTYRYLVGVMRESWLVLKGLGLAREPEVDHLTGRR